MVPDPRSRLSPTSRPAVTCFPFRQ
jgi:hypothetical protein